MTLARPSMDPQAVWPSLVVLSRLARERGLRAEAESALDEVTDGIAASDSAGDAQQWHIDLVLAARRRRSFRGRERDRRTARGGRVAKRVHRGARGTACGCSRHRSSATGRAAAPGRAASSRRGDARHRGTARPRRRRSSSSARAFWTSVGATAYLREADDLSRRGELAASRRSGGTRPSACRRPPTSRCRRSTTGCASKPRADEDARRDRRARARLADRDDRPVAREVGRAEREQAVRDVPAARRCSPCRARPSRGRR